MSKNKKHLLSQSFSSVPSAQSGEPSQTNASFIHSRLFWQLNFKVHFQRFALPIDFKNYGFWMHWADLKSLSYAKILNTFKMTIYYLLERLTWTSITISLIRLVAAFRNSSTSIVLTYKIAVIALKIIIFVILFWIW
jgi:hypothetical protein